MSKRSKTVFAAMLGFGLAAAALAKPDLVISSVTLSTNKAIAGTKIEINSVTKNNGDATGWWKYCDVYYYWNTRATTNGATRIGTGATPNYQEVNGIDKGEEEEDTLNWTIPQGTAPGIYYIICAADAEGEIDESNEGNNTRSVKFTVQGKPAFSDLKWLQPLDVSSNDWVSAYGECANLSTGRLVTLKVRQSKTGLDADAGTYYTRVRSSGGTHYFNLTMTASWPDGDYYFEASASEGAYSCEGSSGEEGGEMLKVSNDRMKPSYSPAKNDFYYDNDSGNESAWQGASSGKVALTDDRIPIILVHGMSGDAKPSTLNYWYGWMNANSVSNTPLGYFNQSPMSSMYRVYRYVYDSRDNISTNGDRLAKFVNDFYASHTNFNGRQVVIMAHSMGGLVSRYAMNHNPTFAAKVHRLVTLGSPHLGAQGANPTWIKFSGPDDNSWFVSSIYNTFNLHNNTAGCFDLAWHSPAEIPEEALTEEAIEKMGDSYRKELMRNSITNPFTGWDGMRTNAADNKCVLFGGSSTNQIGNTLRESWPADPKGEVKTDHLGLWVATKIYRSMSYRDGTGVGDNDGLVPVISALMSDSLGCALPKDRNAHPTAVKYNLNATEGQQVDHASYLDVPVTMDSVKAVLLTQVQGICQPADAVAKGAMWQLVDNVTGERSPWQRTTVRLPALVAGRSYTVNFGKATNYTAPASLTFTATKSVTKRVVGTYKESGAANQAPTDLELSNASVPENSPEGTLVGTLSACDPEGSKLTFELVSGQGSTGNGCFRIVENELRTAQVFDYEAAPQHFCRIRVSDTNGASTEAAFTIDVLDVTEATPATATGDAWLTLGWEPARGASYYRVDVTAGEKGADTVYTVPKAPLGTNEFIGGQFWRYDGEATTTAQGYVKVAPAWFQGWGTTTNGHALCGTNGVGLWTTNLPLLGASAASISFTHGNWNGGKDTNTSTIAVSYRFDGADDWQTLGSSTATSGGDGGEVTFTRSVDVPNGAGSVEFKLEAPNARRDENYQRGPYVRDAAVTLSRQGDFSGANVHLADYPRRLNVTEFQIQGLPAETEYWYRVEAMVDGRWVEVASGKKQTEDTVPAPTGLAVAAADSTSLTATWTDPGAVDHFEVELTPVVAAGTEAVVSEVPNIYLRQSGNTSGWGYSTNHTPTSWGGAVTWFVSTTNVHWDYHVLLGARAPGIQSEELDLSGYESATLRFVARARASADGVSSPDMVLSYSLDGGASWTAAGSATTNTIYLRNSDFIYLDLPAAALAESVKLELSCPEATANWGSGVRNATLLGVGKPAPDYGAETAVALEPVPAPLANAVEATNATAEATAKGLETGTNYWIHVRSVDRWGHKSAWVETSGRTGAASAPTGLSLSGRSIRANNEKGEYIGQLSAEDADEGDEIRYELADGEGSEGNALVEVRGETLRAAGTFRAEDGATRRVRVRATDSRGLWTEQVFELDVLPVAEGVLIRPAEFAAMAAGQRGVEFTSASADGEDLKATWTDAGATARTKAAAGTKYDVYVSTDLREGFVFQERVESTEWSMPRDAERPVTFWTVLVAE